MASKNMSMSAMTDRDLFAALALQGLLARPNLPSDRMELPKVAVELADALVRALRGE